MHDMTRYGIREVDPTVTGADAEAIRAEAGAFDTLLAKWDADDAAIRADADLTPAGRDRKVAERTNAALAEIDRIADTRQNRTGLAKRIADIRAALATRFEHPATLSDLDRHRLELREREVREVLRALPPIERFHRLRQAAAENDLETLRAAYHAPVAARLIPAEQFEQVDALHRAKYHGAQTAALDAAERAAGVLDYNTDLARRIVRGEVHRRRAA